MLKIPFSLPIPLAWTETPWIFVWPRPGYDSIPGKERRRGEKMRKGGWKRGGKTKQRVAMVMKGLLLYQKYTHRHTLHTMHSPEKSEQTHLCTSFERTERHLTTEAKIQTLLPHQVLPKNLPPNQVLSEQQCH